MTPGFHVGIPAERYHADPCMVPSLNNGVAKILLQHSALAAWHAHPKLNPNFRAKQADKFDLGQYAHAMLLEDDRSKLVVVEADDWRTKAAKETRDAARASGKVALLARHVDAVFNMVTAAKEFIANSEIADEWKHADSEVTAVAIDHSGAVLRCRYDRISKSRRFIADYKSTEDASPDTFSRQITRMGYHIQDAFYRRIAQINGVVGPRFVFLAQSVEAPHECSLHACDPALQEIAEAEVQRAIDLWRECMKAKNWPSYGGRIHYAMPTTWMMQEHELRMLEAA